MIAVLIGLRENGYAGKLQILAFPDNTTCDFSAVGDEHFFSRRQDVPRDNVDALHTSTMRRTCLVQDEEEDDLICGRRGEREASEQSQRRT